VVSQEEKEKLISEIEKHTGKRPFAFLKFCSQEQYAQDVIDGNLFSHPAEWFRKKEIESGERGQGDKFELAMPFRSEKISLYNYETGNHIMDINKSDVTYQIIDDDKLPIVCFVGIPLRDMNLLEYDETHAVFSFPYTQEEYDTLEEKFGKYCVIINARELENKIYSYCDDKNCDYIFGKVEYCHQNSLERMKAFMSACPTRALFKNDDLAYQREYRLVLPLGVLEDNFVRVGELKNAKYLEASQLKSIVIDVAYTTKPKE